MWGMNVIIFSLLLQSLFITNIDGNAYRRHHRRRRQSSGSLYGTNANLGASAPAGFNYPASTNFEGTRLNYPDARDRYNNPMIMSSNGEGTLTSVDLNNQPRPQQQQVYGTNDQAVLNSYFSGSSFYNNGGTNQLLRDANGNLLPPGSVGSSFYSSNPQLAYPANTNQMLMNKDLYGAASNTNNYNQYGYSSNQLPNSNTYGGPMGSNSNNNNNLLPNTNTYGGSFGSGANLVPNSGYQGSGSNDNSWMNTNTNNYNRFGQNSANSLYPSRDANYNYNNNNNNNRYPNNNNRYANPNSYYNHSDRLTTSFLVISLTALLSIIFH